MINGFCTTNLDDAKRWTWPKKFVSTPRIGDRVHAKENGSYTCLKVCGVTHAEDKNETPYIIVELNK